MSITGTLYNTTQRLLEKATPEQTYDAMRHGVVLHHNINGTLDAVLNDVLEMAHYADGTGAGSMACDILIECIADIACDRDKLIVDHDTEMQERFALLCWTEWNRIASDIIMNLGYEPDMDECIEYAIQYVGDNMSNNTDHLMIEWMNNHEDDELAAFAKTRF